MIRGFFVQNISAGSKCNFFRQREVRYMYNDSAMSNDYYAILDLSTAATSKEVKNAWKRLAKRWHPDICKSGDAHARFLEISEAYRVLADPYERRRYDCWRRHHSRSAHYAPQYAQSYSPAMAGNVLEMIMQSAFTLTQGLFLSWLQLLWQTPHESR